MTDQKEIQTNGSLSVLRQVKKEGYAVVETNYTEKKTDPKSVRVPCFRWWTTFQTTACRGNAVSKSTWCIRLSVPVNESGFVVYNDFEKDKNGSPCLDVYILRYVFTDGTVYQLRVPFTCSMDKDLSYVQHTGNVMQCTFVPVNKALPIPASLTNPPKLFNSFLCQYDWNEHWNDQADFDLSKAQQKMDEEPMVQQMAAEMRKQGFSSECGPTEQESDDDTDGAFSISDSDNLKSAILALGQNHTDLPWQRTSLLQELASRNDKSESKDSSTSQKMSEPMSSVQLDLHHQNSK